jgi:RNA polymerase sigma-70 factor, ECF subfamily
MMFTGTGAFAGFAAENGGTKCIPGPFSPQPVRAPPGRRSPAGSFDRRVMSLQSPSPENSGRVPLLSAVYDEGLPAVYGYLVRRCGSVELAEDLTSTTFVAAATAVRRGTVRELTIPWLVGVARHKLVDHWRRQAIAHRSLTRLEGAAAESVDPAQQIVDADAARGLLHALPADYRTVLTLRYLDDLSVPETADLIGRSVHATESLLSRARHAFRDVHDSERPDSSGGRSHGA